jgi:DNA-directed RNA polymerase subunit L
MVNKGDTTISVKVKATETGCFQIWIQTAQMTVRDVRDLLTGPNVTALVALLVLLGFLNGPENITGLITLIKRLCGKSPKKITPKGENELEIETESGTVTISKLEWEMYKNPKIRLAAYNIVKPVEKAGVETVEFIDGDKTPSTVTKSDVKHFIPPAEKEEPLQESVREVYVNIVRLWFKDGNEWRFSEGESQWNAEIKDQKFLERLLKDEITLRAHDFLKVKVKQTQYTVGSNVKSDYEILEVLEIKQSPRQSFLI